MHLRHLSLALLATTGLMAQGLRTNWGLQAGLSFPTGDFADKKDRNGDNLGAHEGGGLHFGGHFDFNFTHNHQLRLMLDATAIAGKKQDIYRDGLYDGTRQNIFGVGQLGADYVFNATSPSRGGYFLVGLNVNRVKGLAEYSLHPSSNVTQSCRPGFRVGGGYTFNRIFSVEGHVNSVSVEKSGQDGLGYDAIHWLAVSAVFRFGRP